MPKKTKKQKPETAKVPAYHAYVKVFGKVYEASGATAIEALGKLNPGVAKGMSIVSVEHDGRRKDKVLSPIQSLRLFNGGRIVREVSLKNLSILFQ